MIHGDSLVKRVRRLLVSEDLRRGAVITIVMLALSGLEGYCMGYHPPYICRLGEHCYQ